MKHPLISVVIPAYNAEDYLDRTLQSALGQTYKEIEIILVDDGSTDSTNWIGTTFASQHEHVRVISTKNGGVAQARNVGIDTSNGEFIAFLDADDLWHPSKIEEQVAALTDGTGEQAAAAYSQMRIIDWEDRVIRNGSGIAQSGHLLARHMFARPVGNCSSLFVRREVALEFGGFDTSWRARGIGGCEDLDFELKIAAKYPIMGIQRYLVGYRSHSDNMSSNALGLARAVVAAVEKHIALHPELPAWAVQKIRASTLEFALQNISIVGDRRLFLSELKHLYNVDLRRGASYTARYLARKLIREQLGIKKTDENSRGRPLFYSLDPSFDGGAGLHRDTAVLAKLEQLDATLGSAHHSDK